MVKLLIIVMAVFCPLAYAESIDVNQDKLKEVFSCNDTTKTVCFSNAEVYPEYNIYIFNFIAEVKDINLKGMTIEQYISKSMGPLLGLINPKAAKFYNIEPIMRKLIDESLYSVENAILGLTVNYKGEAYIGSEWVKGDQTTVLSEKIEKIDQKAAKPVDLLINDCENIKLILGRLTKEQNDQYCNYE
ncbi:hypothetical protein C9J48_00865 [Photobacterium profundum]|uniref:Uncharacterized protein n=2 Tax=Photobacterium TaxID=657 RepID=Q1YZ82_9GAMM|nr:hypothetical protein [Photobacterium profundum]EAS41575.1 hypothetical protein P3TCK_18414 [Photobacterium profundum 3TCK]PSV64053.1 hypothetical protein C9J48_00865 [Photobacterium profundum]